MAKHLWLSCICILIIQSLVSIDNVLTQDSTPKNISTCSKPCQIGDDFLMCDQRNCTAIPDLYHEAYNAQRVYLLMNSIANITYMGTATYLQELFLADNQISDIELGAFKQQYYLQHLDLSRNRLTELKEEYFTGLTGLKVLDLSGNRVIRLEADTFYENLRALTTLNLGGNMIKSMAHNAFTDMINLKYLHLNDNFLTKIEPNHFLGLDELEKLDLKSNLLKMIPEKAFYECERMKELDLRFNLISTLEKGAFSELKNLAILHLSNNKLPTVTTDMFPDLIGLQSLYLNNNPIDTIQPGSLPKSLVKISLKNLTNLQRILNGTFTSMPKLTTVEIVSNGKLNVIEVGAFRNNSTVPTAVTDLSLFNNSLMTLQQSLLNWSIVDEPELVGNKWVCDCNMAWVVIDDVFSKDVRKEIVCDQPHHLRGYSVNEVDFTQFSCSFFTVHRFQVEVGLILLITAVFISMAAFLVYRFRHSLLPCCYIIPGKYTSMYNAVNNDDDDEKVKLKWDSQKSPGLPSYKSKESREIVEPGPTAV